ncbi:MAG TPA: nickel-responsive transcriptional regulator NikR [Lacunisphaera sp.]|jgi:CopG family nickel-responsive transcriptional regulator
MTTVVLPLAGSPASFKVPVRMPRRQASLARFSVSLPSELLDELDDMVVRRKLPNRSHAIAEMAREQLTEHAREFGTKSMAGTISLVYDYRKRNLQRKLADIQHGNYLMVVTSMNVHLEHHHYLEVLLVQGPARELRRLADTLAACKGVKHAKLSLTATAMPPLL